MSKCREKEQKRRTHTHTPVDETRVHGRERAQRARVNVFEFLFMVKDRVRSAGAAHRVLPSYALLSLDDFPRPVRARTAGQKRMVGWACESHGNEG